MELRRRHRLRHAAQSQDALLDVGTAQDAVDLGVEPFDHRRRRAGWRVKAEHGVGVEALEAGLGQCRHIREQGRARRAAHGQQAQLARAHVRQADAGIEVEVDLAGQEVGQGRRRAAVGHVHGEGAGLALQHLGRQMRRAAGARAAEAAPAGVGLEVGNEAGHVLGRVLRAHHEEDQHARRGGHRHDVLGRIERHPGVDVRVDRHHAAGTEQQRVAVRCRLGDHVAAQVAAGAGAVLDQHRLAQRVLQGLGDDAGDDVGGAAGREVDHHLDGLGGPGLGLHVGGGSGGEHAERGECGERQVECRSHGLDSVRVAVNKGGICVIPQRSPA